MMSWSNSTGNLIVMMSKRLKRLQTDGFGKEKEIKLSKYGYYTKNSGDISTEFGIKPTPLYQITSDHAERPAVYGIALAPGTAEGIESDTSPWLYVSSGGATRLHMLFNQYKLGLSDDDFERIHMVASDKKSDASVWIGAGTKLLCATGTGVAKEIDLSRYKVSGEISKLVSRQGELWVLCGADIFKVSDGVVSCFYTSSTGLYTFAVDNDYVFTSDGYKIIRKLQKAVPILGAEPKSPTGQAAFNEAKAALPGCLMEVTGNPTDWYLYLLSVEKGKIYKVHK